MREIHHRYISGTPASKSAAKPTYQLRLLGQPDLIAADGPVPITSVRGRAVLWYLAAQPRRRVPRSWLVDLLWDDCLENEGRNRLRTTLSRLRAELPVWPVGVQGDALWWDPAAGIQVDTTLFADLRQSAYGHPQSSAQIRAALSAAAALWQGPFLDAFQAPQCARYQDWVMQERQRWDQEVLAVLNDLHRLDQAAADWPAVIARARAALRVAPLHEEFHRRLMFAHAQQGDRAQAMACYAACERLLQSEVGVTPDPETVALKDAIASGRLERKASVPAPSLQAPPVQPPLSPVPALPEFPLIGRSRELSWIRQGLQNAWSGRGRVLMLHGEAGIGKSRLAHAVAGLGRGPMPGAAGHRTLLIGHGYESAAGLPYAPFVEALTSALPAIEPGELSLDGVWLVQVSRLLPDLARITSGWPARIDADGESEFLLYEGVARFLAALPSPLLLLLEDVHWADTSTLQLLAYLARHPGLGACAILATARSGAMPERVELLLHDLARQGVLEWLTVDALTEAEVGELVEALTGRCDAAMAARVYSETRGNPLFATEVIRSLKERSGQGGEAAGGAAAMPIPPSVQAVIRGQLSRLPAQSTDFLAAAAIFPVSAPFEMIREVSGLDEGEALTALEAQLRSGILQEEEAAGARPGVTFRHDLIRRTVAHSTSNARRESLHRRAFDCLVRAAGPDPSLQTITQLAHHAPAGGLWEQGVEWNQRAAAAANRIYAYSASVPQLEQALKCLEQLPPTPERQRLGIDLRLRLHFAAFYSHPDRLLEWVLPALETARSLGDELRLAKGRTAHAAILIFQGAFAEARSLLEQTLPAARASGDTELLGPLLRLLGAALHLLGEFDRSLEVLAEAIPLQDKLKFHLNQISARAVVNLISVYRGQLDDGLIQLSGLEQESRLKGDTAGVAHALSYMTFAWHLKGEWAKIAQASEEGLRLAREAALPFYVFQAGMLRGPALARLGHPEAAVAHQESNVELGRKLRGGFLLGLAYAALAETYLATGRTEEAVNAARTGFEASVRSGAPLYQAVCRTVWGQAALALGDQAAARSHLTESLQSLIKMGCRPYAGRCHAALALAGETAEERAWHLREAARLFRTTGMAWDLRQLSNT